MAGINTYPLCFFFVPYYSLGVLGVVAHLAAMYRSKAQRSILAITPGQRAAAILVIGVLFTGSLFASFTNHFRGIGIPVAYKLSIGR